MKGAVLDIFGVRTVLSRYRFCYMMSVSDSREGLQVSHAWGKTLSSLR
jgi:hypothetical protein